MTSDFRVGRGLGVKMTPKIGRFRVEKDRYLGQKSLKIVGRHYWTFSPEESNFCSNASVISEPSQFN